MSRRTPPQGSVARDVSQVRKQASIDDTDSPFTTDDEDVIYANSTNGPITVELSTSDLRLGNAVVIVDVGLNASQHNITVQVPSGASEAIDPGGASSKTLDVNGVQLAFEAGTTNWHANLNRLAEESTGTSLQYESVAGIADHIVTPSDDLNDIINNQLKAGESVWIGGGEHTVTKSQALALNITVADVTIDGIGTTKLEDSATSFTGNSDDEGVWGISADNVTIRNIVIDGNKANQSPGPNDRISGIVPTNADDYTIENVEVKNCTNGGIKNAGSTGVGGRINGCHIHDMEKDGIMLTDDEITGEGNRVEDCPTQDGIEPVGDRHTWRGNVVKNTAGSGFDCYDTQGTVIADNVVIVGPNGPANLVSFNGASAPGAQDCIAEGNVMVGSEVTGEPGVADKPAAIETQTDCQLIDNVFIGCDTQLQISQGDVTIEDNAFIDFATDAVELSNAVEGDGSDIVFKDNYIQNPGSEGVVIKSTATACVVEGNVIRNAGSEGIFDEGGVDNTIRDNRIYDSAGAGIRYLGTTGGVITDNGIFNSGGGGITVSESSEVYIAGNRTRSTAGDAGLVIDEGDSGAQSDIIADGHHSQDDSRGIRILSGTGTLTDYTIRDVITINPTNQQFLDAVADDSRTIENVDGFTEAGGGETTVDNGGTIAHGLSEAPDRYYVGSRDAGEYAHVTSVDATNLTVEVLAVSDGTGAGLGNNVVWEAKTPAAP